MLCMILPVRSQENTVVTGRTPEQEASKQTEKLQQELNLTPEQIKQIYDINLRYERQRQVSNTRSEAMERIKNKNADMQRILSEEQNNRLQNKRYERSSFQSPNGTRSQQTVNPTGLRSANENQANPNARVRSNDANVRNNNKGSVNSQYRNGLQSPQTTRQSTTVSPRTPQLQNNPSSTRSTGGSTVAPTRTERSVSPQQNSSTRSQGTPSNTPRSTERPGNSNRR